MTYPHLLEINVSHALSSLSIDERRLSLEGKFVFLITFDNAKGKFFFLSKFHNITR